MEIPQAPDQLRQIGSWKNLEKFVDLLREFQNQDMDLLIPIDGFKGSGKTTCGCVIIKKYLEKYMNENFNPDKYIAYDNYEVQEKINNLPPFSPLLCDEAVRFALGEDWQKQESKELKKIFTQIRTKHLIIFFCIPNFFWLDKKYREDMSAFWVHTFSRGYALIFTPDLRIGVEDKWHRKEFEKKITRPLNLFSNIENVLPFYRKHPCYWADLQFPKLEQPLYDRYLGLRDSKALAPSPSLTRIELIKLVIWKLHKQFNLTSGDLSDYLLDPRNNRYPFANKLSTIQAINHWLEDMNLRYNGVNDVKVPWGKRKKAREEVVKFTSEQGAVIPPDIIK